jgi:hypothetical protein
MEVVEHNNAMAASLQTGDHMGAHITGTAGD